MTRAIASLGMTALLAAAAGCGTVQVEPHTELPAPLVEKLPATVAIYYPAEFSEYVHKETRYQVDYEILLGPAHVAKLRRLLGAMFARVIEVDDPAKARAADPDVRLVLEPRFEDYAFLTPKDMVGESYTVTIRYRLNLYNPLGERVDGYVFTGFGREQSGAMGGSKPLMIATQRAMRDAGAKLAVELTSQESVRRLLAGEEIRPQPRETATASEALGSFGPPAEPAAGGAAAPGTEAGGSTPGAAMPSETASAAQPQDLPEAPPETPGAAQPEVLPEIPPEPLPAAQPQDLPEAPPETPPEPQPATPSGAPAGV